MGRGFVAFLVVLAFAPLALETMGVHHLVGGGISEARQFLVEQQALTIQEQDIEDTFGKVMRYSASRAVAKTGQANDAAEAELAREVRRWAAEMELDAWTGKLPDSDYSVWVERPPAEFEPERHLKIANSTLVQVNGTEWSAIGVTITAGSSKGIYLIPRGVDYEYH